MKLHATSYDDPGFVRLVSLILDSLVLKYAPEILAIIEVDNWFDHKWLNFSGNTAFVRKWQSVHAWLTTSAATRCKTSSRRWVARIVSGRVHQN